MSDTSQAPKWTSLEISVLRAAYAAGGSAAAVRALPGRSIASVHTAIRRYVGRPETPPVAIDAVMVRARLRALSIDVFEDGFVALRQRTANYRGADV